MGTIDRAASTANDPVTRTKLRAAYSTVMKAFAENSADRGDLFMAYHSLGEHFAEETEKSCKGNQQAVEAFREALNHADGAAPKSVSAVHGDLAIQLKRLGETDAALAEYRAAIKANPADPLNYSNMGILLRELGDFSGAVDACKKAIAAQPKRPAGHLRLGNVLQDMGDYKGALSALKKALRLVERLPRAERPSQGRYAMASLIENAIAGCLRDSGPEQRKAAIEAYKRSISGVKLRSSSGIISCPPSSRLI